MMPAGTYYVGDLCYVMHDEWDEVCKLTIVNNECLDGEFNLSDGRRFAMFRTQWGDGTYEDEERRKYDVDAGLIGCILIDDIDLNSDHNELVSGNVIRFDKPFECYSDHGTIVFGHVMIETDPDTDSQYDDELEYEDE